MSDTTHFGMRDSRDRIIDLLNFANTYPLQDLPVPQTQLTIPFGNSAKVSIEHSQTNVVYQLHSLDGNPITKADDESAIIEEKGNDGTLTLETNPIDEDITYKIFAIKQHENQTLGTYLHKTAVIKVGLDTTLDAEILDLPFLDSTAFNPQPKDARIADYGIEVTVEVQNSQEAVEYTLVVKDGANETVISKPEVGDLKPIKLIIPSVIEDIDIVIKAEKSFADGRPTEVAYLDTVLPLRVRANPEIALTMPEGHIINFNEAASLSLQNTQQLAEYQLFLRPVRDEEIVHLAPAEQEFLMVPVPDQPDVPIRKPPYTYRWTIAPEGFSEISNFQAGAATDLTFTLPALTHESMIIVQLRKHHKRTADVDETTTIPSFIRLRQSLAILVRPNPDHPVHLKTEIINGNSGTIMEWFDGQPGVFYQLQQLDNNSEIGRPAYFHKHDDLEPTQNKGIDQLTVEVDFVVARSFSEGSVINNPTETPLLPPQVEVNPIPTNSILPAAAVKAMTRVSAVMTHPVSLPEPPVIQLQDEIIDYGGSTKILVLASIDQERYEPFLNDVSYKRVRIGNGDDLSFNVDALTEDTTFELRITPVNDTSILVERYLTLTVIVRPNTALTVLATEAIVPLNSPATLLVEDSQPGTHYQLMANGVLIGTVFEGTGDTIALESDPLTEETTFSVQATKIIDDNITVVLNQTVTVTVNG